MQRFYSNLAKADDKGTALRDAKLALIKEHGNLHRTIGRVSLFGAMPFPQSAS
jgi:hypothetical protein